METIHGFIDRLFLVKRDLVARDDCTGLRRTGYCGRVGTFSSVSASAAAAWGAKDAASALKLSALPCSACMNALNDVGLSIATCAEVEACLLEAAAAADTQP